MDIVLELLDAINDDTELATALGVKVYGHRIPDPGTRKPVPTPPLVVVTAAQATPSTRPQTQWWRTLASVDFHANDPATALELAARMREIAPTIVGGRATCVITDCQVESIQPVIDDGWTPTRFRQVVTVDVTAREP
jgi:hypothetical protein